MEENNLLAQCNANYSAEDGGQSNGQRDDDGDVEPWITAKQGTGVSFHQMLEESGVTNAFIVQPQCHWGRWIPAHCHRRSRIRHGEKD